MSGNRECSSGGSRGADAPGGRRAALRARTRDEILDAAAELVTERGVDELNLNELAVRAGFVREAEAVERVGEGFEARYMADNIRPACAI